MSAFLEGILAGYGIAIPVGAIAVLIVDMGLRRGFGPGFMAGAGAASVDTIYASLAVLAGATIGLALAPYALVLRLASAAVLLLIGGYGLRKALQTSRRQESGGQAGNDRGLLGIYLRFLGLTLLNPLTVAYFAALILGRDAGLTVTPLERLLFVLGAGLASLSWQTLLAGLGALANRRLTPRFQKAASLVGNLVVMAFGLRIVLSLVAL